MCKPCLMWCYISFSPIIAPRLILGVAVKGRDNLETGISQIMAWRTDSLPEREYRCLSIIKFAQDLIPAAYILIKFLSP